MLDHIRFEKIQNNTQIRYFITIRTLAGRVDTIPRQF